MFRHGPCGGTIELWDSGRHRIGWPLSRGDRGGLAPSASPAATAACQVPSNPSTLVDEAIRTVYLTKARRPISAVTRRVLEDLQRLNARLPAAQAIPVPRQAAWPGPLPGGSTRWIHGKSTASAGAGRSPTAATPPTSPQQLATRILQRVEMDHSPLKVVVGTEAGPIGQPWLTLLIDYYSRMVVGFCLGFEPPSYAVIMEALRHAILPKTYRQGTVSRGARHVALLRAARKARLRPGARPDEQGPGGCRLSTGDRTGLQSATDAPFQRHGGVVLRRPE